MSTRVSPEPAPPPGEDGSAAAAAVDGTADAPPQPLDPSQAEMGMLIDEKIRTEGLQLKHPSRGHSPVPLDLDAGALGLRSSSSVTPSKSRSGNRTPGTLGGPRTSSDANVTGPVSAAAVSDRLADQDVIATDPATMYAEQFSKLPPQPAGGRERPRGRRDQLLSPRHQVKFNSRNEGLTL